MISILSLLTNKFVGYVVTFFLVSGLLVSGYLYWKSTVEAGALDKFNQAQMAQVVADNVKLAAQLKQLQSDQNAIASTLSAKNSDLDASIKAKLKNLSSAPNVKADKLASKILRDLIASLPPTN
jgi:hypothetical protein